MFEARHKGLSIKARHSKVLFCGSSAIGKSNFVNLLLKKKFEESHKPTGVTESHQLLAKQITLVKSQCDSKICELEYLSFEKQIRWLRWFFKAKNYHSSNFNDDNVDKEKLSGGPTSQPQQTLPVENVVAQSDIDVPSDNPPVVWNLLTFLDTGGQPSFINMLPAVNSSAMITFIILSMEDGVEGLTKKVTVYGDGPQYSLDYDNIDLVKMLFSMRKPKESHVFEQLLTERSTECDKNCYLSLVGTKSDLCGDRVQVAKSIYNKLEPIIDQTICKSSLIAVDGNYFVPVSNCKAGTDDEDPMASKIRNCIHECLEKRDIYYIPIVWLILELEIQSRTKVESVITFTEIFEICEEGSLITDEADIRTALKFFHHIGIFLYYSSNDSEMKSIADIVITNYQWVFENLTQMVKAAKSTEDISKDLRCNGRLNKQVINHIDWKLGNNVDKKYFLKLLEKLAIISPTKRTDIPDEYFMPCVLPTFSFDSTNEQHLLENYGTQGKAESLLMQLVYEESDIKSCYYDDHSYLLPIGVFCCLINQLLLNHSRFKVQWSESDSDPCVFNNLIVLYDDIGECFVVLIDRFMYLEIQIRQNAKIKESEYHEIKNTINYTLIDVCDNLALQISYIRVGFQCLADGKLYWTRGKDGDQDDADLTMYSHNNKPKKLTESQKIWFSGQLDSSINCCHI